MEGFESRGSIQEATCSVPQDLNQLQLNTSGDAVFDASQYAFFGKDSVEEVELGGLDEEEAPVGFDEEEFLYDREQGDVSLSDIDDLSLTFEKLNKDVSGTRCAGVIGDRGSRESSSAAEWAQEHFPNWIDEDILDAESLQDGKRWSSQPFSSSARPTESLPLYKTSSYPEPQQQQQQQQQQQHHHHQHFSSEPILVPKSGFTSYPPPGGISQQASPNRQSSHLNPYLAGGPQGGLSSSNHSPYSNSQLQMTGLPHGSHFGKAR